MPQLLDFRLSLARIVHLPVPSENLRRRGNKIVKSFPRTTDDSDRALEQKARGIELQPHGDESGR
jgi:hypothetical protein